MIKKIKSWLLENRHAKQIVAKNTFWLAIGTIASRFIKAIIIIYAARRLGIENYGVFSYALSLAALFSAFADIGTGGILTREVARDPESLEKNLSSSLAIKLSVVLLSVILVGAVAPYFSAVAGAASLMPLAALLIAFDSLRDFSFSITRAWQKMEVEAGVNMVTGIGITVFGLAALWIRPTPMVLMAGYVLGSGLGLLVAVLILGKYLKNFWKLLDWQHTKKMLKDSLPFALGGLLSVLAVNTDAVIIGWLRSAGDVGLYAAAQRPVLLIYMISGLLATSSFPAAMQYVGKNEERVRYILEKVITAALIICIPIFVGGAILSSQIISFLFGSAYVSAAATFAVLLFTVVILAASAPVLNTIFAYNQQRFMVVYLLIGGVGNIIFDYLLIRPYGILGSSFATVISQLLAYAYISRRLKMTNDFHILIHLKKIIAAAAVMGLASFAMSAAHLQVLINILISALVYLGALILFREEMVAEAKTILHLEIPAPEL